MHHADLPERASRNQPRIAAVLALATVAFGASTVYLARSLQAERTRNSAFDSMAMEVPALSEPAATIETIASGSAASTQDPFAQAQTSAVMPSPSAAEPGAEEEARLRRRLEELSDPAQRAQRIADMRIALRSNAEMLTGIGLSTQEAERALDVMARLSVEDQLHSTQCRMAPGCDLKAETRSRARFQFDEFERAVGVHATQKILREDARQRVQVFAKVLPAEQALSDFATDQLVEAYTAGRRRWVETTDPLPELHQQLQQQAATILTAEQLKHFTGRQQRYFDFD